MPYPGVFAVYLLSEAAIFALKLRHWCRRQARTASNGIQWGCEKQPKEKPSIGCDIHVALHGIYV